MNIHYKIVEVWPSDHLIVARYWTDIITEQYLANSDEYFDDGSPRRCRSDVSITLPTPTPTGKDLEDIIMRNAPSYWLKTLEDVADPFVDTSMQEILSMRGKSFIKEYKNYQEETTPVLSGVLSDEEIQKIIQRFNN